MMATVRFVSSGSVSLSRTATVTGVAWAVVAVSGTATGGEFWRRVAVAVSLAATVSRPLPKTRRVAVVPEMAEAGMLIVAWLPPTSWPAEQVTTWPAIVQPGGGVPGVIPAGR